MPKRNLDDSTLIEMIQIGGTSNREAIEIIYNNDRLKGMVSAYVKRMGGDETDARDVFHEGIIGLERSIRRGQFKQETSIEGYLYSICRFTWNNMWRKKNKFTSDEPEQKTVTDLDNPESLFISNEKKKLLDRILSLLDDQCQKILTLWKSSYSMKEIAKICNLSSENLAKKYRYRCMKKLTQTLKSNHNLLAELKYV